MEIKIEKLGKVAITVAKDFWSIDKAYDRLVVIEEEGVAVYLSKIPVPKGISLTNTKYWQKLTNINGQGGGGSTNDFTDAYKEAVDDYIAKKTNLAKYVQNDVDQKYLYNIALSLSANFLDIVTQKFTLGQTRQHGPSTTSIRLPNASEQFAGILTAEDYTKFNNLCPEISELAIQIKSNRRQFDVTPGLYRVTNSRTGFPTGLFTEKYIGFLIVTAATQQGGAGLQRMTLISPTPMVYPKADSEDYGYPNLSTKFTFDSIEKYITSGIYTSTRQYDSIAHLWGDWSVWSVPEQGNMGEIADTLIEAYDFAIKDDITDYINNYTRASLLTTILYGAKRPTNEFWHVEVPGIVTADQVKAIASNREIRFSSGGVMYYMRYNPTTDKFKLYDYTNMQDVVTEADNYSTIEAETNTIITGQVYTTTITISKTE